MPAESADRPRPEPRAPRADARRNHDRLLAAAAEVVGEQGTQAASLRDVARRAGVGLGTLYRHFPTRDALLETLLRQHFTRLAERADDLAATEPPLPALTTWLYEFMLGAGAYQGLPASLMATLNDPGSELHASCRTLHATVGRLLRAAQETGAVRPDVDDTDLFALVNSLGWVIGQGPTMAARRDHLFELMLAGLARH